MSRRYDDLFAYQYNSNGIAVAPSNIIFIYVKLLEKNIEIPRIFEIKEKGGSNKHVKDH